MKITVLGIAALALAAAASAQPTNTLGPGPITPTHLPVVDTDGTPGPSAGDIPIPISYGSGMIVASTPAGSLIVGASNPQAGTGFGQTFMIENQPYEYQTLTFNQFDGQNRPTGASVEIAAKFVTPARRRALGNVVLSQGTAQLHPLNGQGYHDGVSGQKTGGGFSFDISFVYGSSPNAPGAPDYISLPWADVMTISGQAKGGKSGGLDHQIFVPMTDVGDGTPNAITANFPNAPTFPSPPLAPGLVRRISSVPTLGGWGLILLSLSLVFVGWLQLRRGGVSLGF